MKKQLSIFLNLIRRIVALSLLVSAFAIIYVRAPVVDNPSSARGRVYLKNGNYFDGNIDICSEGNITVYFGVRGMVFSPIRVREIRLANGNRIDENAMGRLENYYSKKNFSRKRFSSIIKRSARIHGVEEELVKAVIRQESGFNPMAISHKGARGLMQLMPQTAKIYGVQNIFDPVENIDAGTKHLAYLINKYNGNKKLALAAYNAGSTAVKNYNGIPPFKETTHYVMVVYQNYRILKGWEL